ncbi:solute carrier family 35 member E1 homolog [Centruroides vittatus]|uniref:solute carrier family 35 member E1 homolog n=1 Tax=Centruroides vittatus TaxID=120091 RepID=UPI00350FD03F
MADGGTFKEICHVIVLCVIWYAVSSGNGVIGKTVLNDLPYPMTVTMVQLLTVTVGCGPMIALTGIQTHHVSITWNHYIKFIVPLACAKFFSSVSSHISIWKVPVSYAHTVKATMPLFTVILSRIIIGEKQTIKVYLSLIPIIIGVIIATITELSFDLIGLCSALIATLVFSLQHIFSKKALNETGIHHFKLLHLLARLALFFFIPIWLIVDVRKMMNDETFLQNTDKFVVLFLLFLDGICNFVQNVVAFSVLSLVSPLTYSVCNATKRISIITVSLILLRNPVTSLNFFGMMLAILGVLCYNKAKYDALQLKKKEPVLPYSRFEKNALFNDKENNHIPYVNLISADKKPSIHSNHLPVFRQLNDTMHQV